MSSTTKPNNFTRFLRNHAALLLLIFCALAVATVVLVVALSPEESIPNDPVINVPNNPTPDTPVDTPNDDTPTVTKVKVYFASPTAYTKVSMGYTDGTDLVFVFNSTLNTWKTHNGVDLVAAEGTAVNAMYDGTVVEVTQTYGMGNIVKVDHGNNVVATYASLADVQVVQGDHVAKGEKLGAVSSTASYEFSDGPHLHLEVSVNGKNTDPMPYVNGEVFREITQEK